VGARVLANIRAQGLLLLGGPEVEPVRALLAELLAAEPVRARLAGMVTGLDIRYPVGEASGHPLAGARLPHLELDTEGGPATAAELLRVGGGLLLHLAGRRDLRWAGRLWSDRVATVAVRPGAAAAALDADAVLVRPDGYVAWAGGAKEAALDALRRWFGPPEPGL
ncbi:oxidoreductase, partial [Streptomyces sp. B1866]|nr:oxidoreductase [Streptomyces sp. B1866]